jgi:O-antigen ligase
MLTILLIILACVWLPILLYQLVQRPFRLLLVWLFIAPVATYLASTFGAISLMKVPVQQEASATSVKRISYYTEPTKLSMYYLLEPTRLLFALWFGVYLLRARQHQRRPVPLNRTEIWMGLFSLLLLASVCLKSWRFAFGLRTAVDAFIVPFLGYYLARRLFTSEARLRQLTRVLAYMGCYVIVIAIIERLTQPELMHRVQGPFEARDVLYVVMAVVFYALLESWPAHEERYVGTPAFPRSIRRFVLVLSPVIVGLTLTRGNWIAFLASLWAFLFLGRRLINFVRHIGVIGLVLLLLPILALILQVIVPPEIFTKRVGQVQNVEGRFATWKATIELGSRAPIWGVGLNNLDGLLSETQVQFGSMKNYTTPHNSFLSIFVELGVVGLITYMALVASMIRMGLHLCRTGASAQDAWRGLIMVALIVAYQVPALFTHLFSHTGLIHVYVYVFIGAITGLYSGVRSEGEAAPVTLRPYVPPLVARMRT